MSSPAVRPVGSLRCHWISSSLAIRPHLTGGYIYNRRLLEQLAAIPPRRLVLVDGLTLAEAVAHGLPVLSTRAGAIAETVPAQAGILVPPGDWRALADALGQLLQEPDLRRRLVRGAAAARAQLPDWQQACRRFAEEIQRLIRS